MSFYAIHIRTTKIYQDLMTILMVGGMKNNRIHDYMPYFSANEDGTSKTNRVVTKYQNFGMKMG